MTNIFQVNEDKESLQRGSYKLDKDLYEGFKKAANNNQMYLAFEYLVQMMEIINEKLNSLDKVKTSAPSIVTNSRDVVAPTPPPAEERPALIKPTKKSPQKNEKVEADN